MLFDASDGNCGSVKGCFTALRDCCLVINNLIMLMDLLILDAQPSLGCHLTYEENECDFSIRWMPEILDMGRHAVTMSGNVTGIHKM